MRVLEALYCISLLLTPISVHAGLYKWVDESGGVHFSDQAPVTEEVKSELLDMNDIGAGVSSVKSDASRRNNVELYSTSWCSYCKKARAFFNKHQVRFRDYDIEKNKAAALKKSRLDNSRGVPFAVINGVKIPGYNEAAYTKALKLNSPEK